MSKLAWCTDIHLNFLPFEKRRKFYTKLADNDMILITGDISDGKHLKTHLLELVEYVKKPIYFVLGNHDYYHSSVPETRQLVEDLCLDEKAGQLLGYMHCYAGGAKANEEGVFICGVDGWADARAGKFFESTVSLNDSVFIKDLKYAKNIAGKSGLFNMMKKLADADTNTLDKQITNAIERGAREIFVLTHVPPYPEASRYKGQQSSDDFQPYFCNVGIGAMLFTKALTNENVKFTVLSGHTHESCNYEKLNNLRVRVGGAEYYNPEIQCLL